MSGPVVLPAEEIGGLGDSRGPNLTSPYVLMCTHTTYTHTHHVHANNIMTWQENLSRNGLFDHLSGEGDEGSSEGGGGHRSLSATVYDGFISVDAQENLVVTDHVGGTFGIDADAKGGSQLSHSQQQEYKDAMQHRRACLPKLEVCGVVWCGGVCVCACVCVCGLFCSVHLWVLSLSFCTSVSDSLSDQPPFPCSTSLLTSCQTACGNSE